MIINSRRDLEALRGTHDYATALRAIAGSTSMWVNTADPGGDPVWEKVVVLHTLDRLGLTEAELLAELAAAGVAPVDPQPPAAVVTSPPTKTQLLAQSAAKRWEIETGGITVNGTPVPTDERTRGVLTAGYVKATADANYQITDWKVGPGVYTTLDAATIIAMANAVEAHVQACFSANKAVDIKINDDTYTTYAQVNEAAEWPVV